MRGAYWIAFVVCAAAATIPLLVTPILPSSDLPEHMAQVAIWKHFDDPCFRFADIFEVRWATPYLLGYLVCRALAVVLSVSVAMKVTVWLSIVLLPLSMRELLKRGGDPWLSLLGFLLAYGYAFYWGFLNFAITIPIGIFFIALLYDARPRMLALTLLGILMMASHALVFVFAAAVTVPVALLRRSWRLLLPLVPASLLMVLFVVRLRETRQASQGGITWKLGLHRFFDLPSMLVANAYEVLGLVVVAVVILAIAAGKPRIAEVPARWVLLAVAGTVFFLAPQGAFGTAYLAPRFAIFVAVGAMMVLDVRASRALVVAIVLAWAALLTWRFQAFGVEAREFEGLLARIPPNRRIALFNVMPFSEHVPGPVYWHFGALYQVRRGGVAAFSFASHDYPQLLGYRPGAELIVNSRSTPVDGIDWPGVLQYDYVLFRGADSRRWLFRDAPVPFVLSARSGSWWLFESPRARAARQACAPLDE